MRSLIKVFFGGMVISFLGTLPLGTMNVANMQVAIEETIENAYYFALGAVLIEMIYVRISLVAIDWILKRKKFMKYMEWATFFIIVALAAGSFIAAASSDSSTKNIFLDNNIHRFFLGFLFNAINPVQIPFWFGWSTVLLTKKVLKPTNISYTFYIVGLGIGTMAGKSIYILGGSWLISKLTNAQDYMNWVIGGIFSLTALLQLYRIVRSKGIDSKMDKLERDSSGNN